MKTITGIFITVAILLGGHLPRHLDRPHAEETAEKLIVTIGTMNSRRFSHTSTLLPNGHILLAGGQNEEALSSVEVFDPVSNTFSNIDPMGVARSSHSATLLPNGKVLIAGGYNGDCLSTTEIYDPQTGKFTPASRMTVARSGHEAVLLLNGKVLLAGGVGTGWTFLSSAEVFDPEAGTFTPTGSMATARESHTATLLNDGRVLITGGHRDRRSAITIYSSAELYNPSTGVFVSTGNMSVRRHKHDAVLLSDGTVLIIGGSDERDREGAYESAEVYEPGTGRFTPTVSMNVKRYKLRSTTILLPNGHALVIGGSNIAERYDPAVKVFVKVDGSMGSDRLFSAATLLPDGRVLITGGYDQAMVADSNAWLYQ